MSWKRSLVTSLFCVCAVHAPPAAAQEGRPANAVYLELLGSGGLYSLNFERRVADAVALRIGAGTWTSDDLFLDDAETSLVTVPVTASWVGGASNRRVELGGGVLLGSKSRDEAFGDGSTRSSFVSLSGIIGYRYQPATPGWMFRLAFTPLLGLGDDDEAYPDQGFTPSIGISGGYTF